MSSTVMTSATSPRITSGKLIGMRELTFLLAFSMTTAWAASPGLAVDYQMARGHEIVAHVRNLANIPATAFIVGTSETNFVVTDSLLGSREGRPLWPAESVEVTLRSASGGARVLAAVFEDGSVTGELQWTERIMASRRAARENLAIAGGLFDLALQTHTDRLGLLRSVGQYEQRYEALHAGAPSAVWQRAMALIGSPEGGDASLEKLAVTAAFEFQQWKARLEESQPAIW